MKFACTLLLLWLTCLQLTAAANHPDSVKSSSTANHTDSLKSTATGNNSDTLIFPISNHKSNLNLSALVRHADSLWEPPRLPGNLSQQVKTHKRDSIKQAALSIRLDSIKFAIYRRSSDSIKVQLKQMTLDSLKRQLTLPENSWFKGHIYNEIASRYLANDTVSNKMQKLNYQTKALNATMMALHQYSRFNDTTGLRACFDNLAKIYYAQKKFSQAKWFILQSNSISRAKKDVPDIISSLIILSSIKSEIKDYKLARKDLDEALQLSIKNHYTQAELAVLNNYALLYSRLKNYSMEAMILKKRDSIEENTRKDEEARLISSLKVQAASQKKKSDSVQSKKKVYILTMHKLYKNSSPRKITSS